MWKILTAVAVWIIAAVLFAVIGAVLIVLNDKSTVLVGNVLQDKALVLGFVTGLAYFFWGKPYTPVQR